MAAIRRVPQMDHTFELVVTRVYEDGDQDLLDDEVESKHHHLLLIPGEGLIRMCSRCGASFPRW